MTVARKFSSAAVSDPAFDLATEARTLYAAFPDQACDVIFIDVSTGQIAAKNDGTETAVAADLRKQEKETAARDLSTLESLLSCEMTLSDKISFYKEKKGCAVVKDFYKQVVLLYQEEDQDRYIAPAPFFQEQCFNIDHEVAHAISRYGKARGVNSRQDMEGVADAYAALRHWQRFGLQSEGVKNLMMRRLACAAFKKPAGDAPILLHFTSPVLEQVLKLKDKIDIMSLTPQQTLALAEKISLKHTPSPGQLQMLHEELFSPLLERDAGNTPALIAASLYKKNFSTQIPEVFHWGSLLLKRMLDNHPDLRGAEWNTMRESLALRMKEYGADPEFFGMGLPKAPLIGIKLENNNKNIVKWDNLKKTSGKGGQP